MRYIAVAVIVFALVGCSDEITIGQLEDRGIDSPEEVFDVLGCEAVSVAAGWVTDGPFDEADALSFAQENAGINPDVPVSVETIIELRPGLWAVGDTSGVALGLVSPAMVSFCDLP